MKFLAFIANIIACFQIIISPTLLGIIFGGLIYLSKQEIFGLVIGGSVVILGLVIGVLWAARVWRKQDPVDYMARLISSPDFDKAAKNKNSKV